ncbi:MAG: PIG-L family deacetylase [Negativicutes bacterium]|nr:PIG-L family deacetylase [Negativicutes bacterium]
MARKVLIVAAHPDDEILGCGGTIAKHFAAGDEVHVIIMADGITSRNAQGDSELCDSQMLLRSRAAQEANKLLGVTSLELIGLPDNRMDSIDLLDVTKMIEDHMERIKPDIVYTHHCSDLNIDHRITHQAVVTACRPMPDQCVQKLLFFEVASSTQWQTPQSGPFFVPNWFTDISSTLDLKMRALEIYELEMRTWPHARSLKAVEHLARWRGATVGINAAEAFVLGRFIDS